MKVGIVPYSTDVEMRWDTDIRFYSLCVGGGWIPLLLDLTNKLEHLGWNGRLLQVKEKFGTLRFYWCNNIRGINGEIAEDVVNEAEARSGQICETCGGYGTVRGHGWLYTSCMKHAKEDDLKDFERKILNEDK